MQLSGENLKVACTNSEQRSGCCGACPFAFTDESEYVQGLGCLPDPYEIKQMKEQSGHNWSCHEDANKMCTGYATHATEFWKHLDIKKGGLISYEDWFYKGPQEAMKMAKIS